MKEDEGEEGTPSAGEVMGLGEKDPIGDTGQAAYRLYTGQAYIQDMQPIDYSSTELPQIFNNDALTNNLSQALSACLSACLEQGWIGVSHSQAIGRDLTYIWIGVSHSQAIGRDLTYIWIGVSHSQAIGRDSIIIIGSENMMHGKSNLELGD